MNTATIERHWANALIGRSYAERGGCWGNLRLVLAEQLGLEVPEVAIGAGEVQAPAIRAAAEASGWRPAALPAREHDVLLMRNTEGQRHVGFVLRIDGTLSLLHCTEARGVELIEVSALRMAGYTSIEAWRRAA